MYNIKITLEYEGSRYKGFCSTRSDNTISRHLSTALERITDKEIDVIPAVKTEPGVHAKEQTVNFFLPHVDNLDDFKKELNALLPQDIAVRSMQIANERFDAGRNLKDCTYLYRIDKGGDLSVFKRNYTHYHPDSLSIEEMKKAASHLMGNHDISKLSSAGKKKKTMKTISDISIIEKENEYQIYLTADRFLKGIPLALVNILVNAGEGNLPANEVPFVLLGEKVSDFHCFSKGLYLFKTTY